MPITEFCDASSSSPPPSSTNSGFFFSILSRRDQFHSMESSSSSPDAAGQETEVEVFQHHVADRFHDLATEFDYLLSIPWLRKLLDAFLCGQEEFKMIMFNNKSALSQPPMERYVSDYLVRNVKALDFCNAIRDEIGQIRQWRKQLEIVLCALDNQRSIGERQFRRAKKALVDLAIRMLDEKQSNSNSTFAQKIRSFGRNNAQRREQRSIGHFRSLSWSVSRSWSAAKQLQVIGNKPNTAEAEQNGRNKPILIGLNMFMKMLQITRC